MAWLASSRARHAASQARAPPDAQADAPAAEAPAAAADEGGERAESAAGATEAAVTDQQQADIDSTRAQVLGLHGPISAELLEEIDALYAEVRRQRQRAPLLELRCERVACELISGAARAVEAGGGEGCAGSVARN